MVENKKILEEAKYIIEGHTIEETATRFNVSVRTIQIHMNVKLKELSNMDDEILEVYNLLVQRKGEISKERQIIGGSIGAKVPTWTTLEVEELTKYMMDANLTIREAANNLGIYNPEYDKIPKSTLYDRIRRGIKNPELLKQFNTYMELNKVRKNPIQPNRIK